MNGEEFHFYTLALYLICGVGLVILLNGIWRLVTHRFASRTEIDPVAEAEAYIAIGRKSQAIEVLNQALLETPNRFYILNKLDELQERATPDRSASSSFRSPPRPSDSKYLMLLNVNH